MSGSIAKEEFARWSKQRDEEMAFLVERIGKLSAALTEIRDLLPIEQDNYSRRVFNIAADALEPTE